MQTLISNTPRRVLGVSLVALLVVASAGISAPAALAAPVAQDTVAQDTTDTVFVPRLIKGSSGGLMPVKRDSAQAKRYFASLERAKAPKSANCPGTICPKTSTCYQVKGALGARCRTS